MIFLKNDLIESDYHWNTDMLHSVLVPTTMFFDRFNGDNILRMINLFSSLVANLSLSEGLRLEQWIVKEMPLQINNEIDVFGWLKTKYLQSKEPLLEAATTH